VIAKHLACTEGTRVKVGDIDRSRLQEVAKATMGEVSTSRLDASDPSKVGEFIRGSDVVINAAHPRLNMLIMKEALKRRVHYVDLAGYPSEQVKQDSKWTKAGLAAILGMGEDPGFSNVMARRAVDMLDHVDEVKIRDGETSTSEAYPFVALFAPDVFLEEAVSPARYFENGETKTSPPMSEREIYRFPPPVGDVPVYRMDHEEVHTLPLYLPKRPKFVDFKLALTDDAVSAIRLFLRLGMLNREPIQVGTAKVSPLNVLLRLLPPPAQIAGKIQGSAGILVEASGEESGQRCIYKLFAGITHEEAYDKYGSNATSYLTGTPTAVCALMLAEGRIDNRGVILPECLDAERFIEEAKKFAINVQIQKTTP